MFPDVADKPTVASRFRSAWDMTPASSLRGAYAQYSPGCVKVKRGLRLNMANNPKKVKDPTEVALSAIQEALNISDAAATDNARNSVHGDVSPANSSSTYDDGAFDARPSADRQIFEPIE